MRAVEPASAREHLASERERLEGLREHFLAEGVHRSEVEELEALTLISQHPADVGTETFDRERDLSILEQIEGELAEVAQALERLDEGTYGRCEACGSPIEEARLEARPEARLCRADQEAAEREARRNSA
jgi:RNA polymerase-binding transcription factor DksA